MVVARVNRLALCLMGDVVPAIEGVPELRVHAGAGWRVYFVQHGAQLIELLARGSTRTQKAGIDRVGVLAARLGIRQGDKDD